MWNEVIHHIDRCIWTKINAYDKKHEMTTNLGERQTSPKFTATTTDFAAGIVMQEMVDWGFFRESTQTASHGEFPVAISLERHARQKDRLCLQCSCWKGSCHNKRWWEGHHLILIYHCQLQVIFHWLVSFCGNNGGITVIIIASNAGICALDDVSDNKVTTTGKMILHWSCVINIIY